MGKRNSLSKLILLGLEKAVDGSVRLDHFINNPKFYALGPGWDYAIKKSALAQALKRLREKGFIEKNKVSEENSIIIKLSEAGKEFLLLSKSEEEIEWDKKWRIVVFDIPENKRSVRDILRNRLKIWGFNPWQQSVWASKKNITNKLRNLIKDLKIEDWVLVIESDNIGK